MANHANGGKPKPVKTLIWKIKTNESAKIARVPALVLSIVSAYVCALISVMTLCGHKFILGYYVFFYLILYTAISFGLFKMSRVAAITYLVVSIKFVVYAWGDTVKLIMGITYVLVALLSIQGVFSYVRFSARDEKETTSNPETPDQKLVR